MQSCNLAKIEIHLYPFINGGVGVTYLTCCHKYEIATRGVIVVYRGGCTRGNVQSLVGGVHVRTIGVVFGEVAKATGSAIAIG